MSDDRLRCEIAASIYATGREVLNVVANGLGDPVLALPQANDLARMMGPIYNRQHAEPTFPQAIRIHNAKYLHVVDFYLHFLFRELETNQLQQLDLTVRRLRDCASHQEEWTRINAEIEALCELADDRLKVEDVL